MSTTALEAQVGGMTVEREKAEQWRYEQFLALGFSEYHADKLAVTRDQTRGFWLYPGDVKRVLDHGCTHELAYELFT